MCAPGYPSSVCAGRQSLCSPTWLWVAMYILTGVPAAIDRRQLPMTLGDKLCGPLKYARRRLWPDLSHWCCSTAPTTSVPPQPWPGSPAATATPSRMPLRKPAWSSLLKLEGAHSSRSPDPATSLDTVKPRQDFYLRSQGKASAFSLLQKKPLRPLGSTQSSGPRVCACGHSLQGPQPGPDFSVVEAQETQRESTSGRIL